MTVPRRWRKSSYSGQEEDCVEVANDLRAVQDSKAPGVHLTGVDVPALVATIRRGELG